MSKFLSRKFEGLEPYVPGEQPRDKKYIKLNTNESPFPPSEKSLKAAEEAARNLQLYPDPECRRLSEKMAEFYRVSPDEVLMTNGSDEILNFAFMAFCDDKHTAVFPDITYGFYPVFSEINSVPFEEIPLKEDFTIDINDYLGVGKTVFLANPNAPTGIALDISDIEKIVASNPKNVVVIDEAYVDFGAKSAVSLIHKYDNLLVTQTFSKSRSLAGGRLGMGIGNAALISDLNAIKYSTNPYNINTVTQSMGLAIMEDKFYTSANCQIIGEIREYTAKELQKLGFTLTESQANFVFAKHKYLGGELLYKKLKDKGILVRHFSADRIKDYNRITIGTLEQMKALINAIKEILEDTKDENC